MCAPAEVLATFRARAGKSEDAGARQVLTRESTKVYTLIQSLHLKNSFREIKKAAFGEAAFRVVS